MWKCNYFDSWEDSQRVWYLLKWQRYILDLIVSFICLRTAYLRFFNFSLWFEKWKMDWSWHVYVQFSVLLLYNSKSSRVSWVLETYKIQFKNEPEFGVPRSNCQELQNFRIHCSSRWYQRYWYIFYLHSYLWIYQRFRTIRMYRIVQNSNVGQQPWYLHDDH